jgi:hypothetical protein
VAAPPRTPPCEHDLTAVWKCLKNGIHPVCVASPPLIGLPKARIFPALIPIPARCDTYLTIAPDAALIESKSSSVSINTQDENCRVGF